MIIAEGLTKRFDNFLAVDDVWVKVDQGQVLVLLGPNGAGKTTIVRMLTSVLTPTSGRATVAGHDVLLHAEKVRGSVGVLTENHGLYGRMNADDYLDFFGQLYQVNRSVLQKRKNQLLDAFGLYHVKNKRLGEYSKGMRQKLALVRALIHEPPVLLLDEPTSAMDPESARMVRDSIINLRSSDRTILLCTHNLAEAEQLANYVAIIWKGKIIACATLKELQNKYLGLSEFVVEFATRKNPTLPELPDGISVTKIESHRVHFRISTPEQLNPLLIKRLIENNQEIVSFAEIPRTLEQVYIEAIRIADKGNVVD